MLQPRFATWIRGGDLLARVRRFASQSAGQAMDLLFPPQCVSCQEEIPPNPDGILLCGDCQWAIGPIDWPRCARCGAAIEPPVPTCPWCDRHGLQFDAVFPLGRYTDVLRSLVLRLKHSGGDSLALGLGRLLAVRRREELAAFAPDLIVPVPMYWRRRLWRGANSAETIAHAIASSQRKLPVIGALRRNLNTHLQKELRLKDRFRNVKGAFRVKAGYTLGGARILLIDDVLTTGATCSVAAEALKKAGAAQVAVAVIARADQAEAR